MGQEQTKTKCTKYDHIGKASHCQFPTCADVCEHCSKASVHDPSKLLCRLCALAEELEMQGSGDGTFDNTTGQFELVFSLSRNAKKTKKQQEGSIFTENSEK